MLKGSPQRENLKELKKKVESNCFNSYRHFESCRNYIQLQWQKSSCSSVNKEESLFLTQEVQGRRGEERGVLMTLVQQLNGIKAEFSESLGSWCQHGHTAQKTLSSFQTARKRAVRNKKIGRLAKWGPLKEFYSEISLENVPLHLTDRI